MEDKFKKTEKLKTYIQITRITILICWISLFAFWAVKLFGGNFFEIVVNNENFLAFSNKVETTWLKYLVSFFTIAIAKYLTFGAICQKFVFKGKQFLFVLFSIFFIWYCANFSKIDFIITFGGYITFILASIIYQKGLKKFLGILAIIFEILFMAISMLVRNVELVKVDNYLIIFILIFDMYIMTALYYLYSNLIKLKKEI